MLRIRSCLHKHVFDLKHSYLDTFLAFVYTETSKNEYVHKMHFKVNTHRNTFTNTLVRLYINGTETLVVLWDGHLRTCHKNVQCLCINSTETLVIFVGWAFICHKNVQCKQGLIRMFMNIIRNTLEL